VNDSAVRSAYPRIVNNFIHDMSTGTWAACVLVVWTLAEQSSKLPGAGSAIAVAEHRVFWLLVISLAGLAVTGALRLAYWRDEATQGTIAQKRAALIAKHVGFLLIYGVGTAWAAWMTFGGTA
jgi:ABC-type anion transport system duplicated permease subunit